MTTQNQAAPGALKSFLTSLLISSFLVAPFIVLSLTPALRRLRAERDFRALKLGHWAGLALSCFLMFVYANVVIDQLPCFLGVPNCD